MHVIRCSNDSSNNDAVQAGCWKIVDGCGLLFMRWLDGLKLQNQNERLLEDER